MGAVAGDAFVHRAGKGRFGPAADAGLGIGCDVGRIDNAERCRHAIAAGIGRTTLGGVTADAISRAGERLALGDQLARETRSRRRIDRRDACSPGQGEQPQRAKNAQPRKPMAIRLSKPASAASTRGCLFSVLARRSLQLSDFPFDDDIPLHHGCGPAATAAPSANRGVRAVRSDAWQQLRAIARAPLLCRALAAASDRARPRPLVHHRGCVSGLGPTPARARSRTPTCSPAPAPRS